MKHRHKLQQQHRRAASSGEYFEVDEANDEQPQSASKRSKRRLAHQLRAEGGRTKHRLDKFRRGKRKGFDGGGSVRNTNPDDPGGEIAAANKNRKGLAGRALDELLGGTRPAYARGGKTGRRRYDAGGAAGPPGGPGGGAAGPLSNSGVPTMTANFPIAPGLFLGKGPPPAPAPHVDNSMNQLLGQINSLKDTGAFDKKSSNDADNSNNSEDDRSSGNRRGGRIHRGRHVGHGNSRR